MSETLSPDFESEDSPTDTDKSFSGMLVRHGRAAHNIAEVPIFVGNKIDSELTEDGRLDAIKVAEQIAESGGCDLIVYGSLIRSQETAEIIQGKLKDLTSQEISLAKIDKIHELDCGDFTGKTREEVESLYPEVLKTLYEGGIEDLNFPNGENYDTISLRIEEVIADLMQKVNDGDRVVIVGHSGFNKFLLHRLFPDQPELWENDQPHDSIIDLEF